MTPVAAGIHQGTPLAYNITPSEDGKVFVTDEDGSHAAYWRNVGKGRVIYIDAPLGEAPMVG